MKRKFQLERQNNVKNTSLKKKDSLLSRLRKTKENEIDLLDLNNRADLSQSFMAGIINDKYEEDSGYDDQKYSTGSPMVDRIDRQVVFTNNESRGTAVSGISTIDKYSRITCLLDQREMRGQFEAVKSDSVCLDVSDDGSLIDVPIQFCLPEQWEISNSSVPQSQCQAHTDQDSSKDTAMDINKSHHSADKVPIRSDLSKEIHLPNSKSLVEKKQDVHMKSSFIHDITSVNVKPRRESEVAQIERRKPPINPSVIVTTEPLQMVSASQGDKCPENHVQTSGNGYRNTVVRTDETYSEINVIQNDKEEIVPVTDFVFIDSQASIDKRVKRKPILTQQSDSINSRNEECGQDEYSDGAGTRRQNDNEILGVSEERLGSDDKVQNNGSGGTISVCKEDNKNCEQVKVRHDTASKAAKSRRQLTHNSQHRSANRNDANFENRTVENIAAMNSRGYIRHKDQPRRSTRDKRPDLAHRSTQSSLKSTEEEGFSTDTSASVLCGAFHDLSTQHKFIEKRSDALINFRPDNKCNASMISNAYDMATAADTQVAHHKYDNNHHHHRSARDKGTLHTFLSQDLINISKASTNTSYLNADGQSLVSHDSKHKTISWPITWLYVIFILILWTSVVGYIEGTEYDSTHACTQSVITRLWCCLVALLMLYFALEVLLERRSVLTSLCSGILVFLLLLISNRQPLSCYVSNDKQQLLRYLEASFNLCFACCMFIYWIQNGGMKKRKRAKAFAAKQAKVPSSLAPNTMAQTRN